MPRLIWSHIGCLLRPVHFIRMAFTTITRVTTSASHTEFFFVDASSSGLHTDAASLEVTTVTELIVSRLSSFLTSATSVNLISTTAISIPASKTSPVPTQTSLSDAPSSQPPASTNYNSTLIDEDHGGLSAGSKAGVALGVIIFFFLLAGSSFLIWRKRTSSSNAQNGKIGIRGRTGARSEQDIADLDMGEVITEPKPKSKSKSRLKEYFSFAFLFHKRKAGADSSLVEFEPDEAKSRRRLNMEGTAQKFELENTNTQTRVGLNDTGAIQTNDKRKEDSLREVQRHDDKAIITESNSAGPSNNVFVHTPTESYSAQGQRLADAEEIAQLEEDARRIDEEIASAERLQQLRNERSIIQSRLREVRRGSSSSLSQP